MFADFRAEPGFIFNESCCFSSNSQQESTFSKMSSYSLLNLFPVFDLRTVVVFAAANWQELIPLQRRSARVQLRTFRGFYNRNIVVAVVLCDEAHGRPVILVVVWVIGDKLLCVGLVQSVNLNSAFQGVAQQEHLHLHKRGWGWGVRGIIAEFENVLTVISCSRTPALQVGMLQSAIKRGKIAIESLKVQLKSANSQRGQGRDMRSGKNQPSTHAAACFPGSAKVVRQQHRCVCHDTSSGSLPAPGRR